MACKNTCKNAVLLEKKRCDIFPPLGVPLCALELHNAAFATKGKLKKSNDIFPPFGVPLCALDLQNAAFVTEAKLKKGLEK